LSDAEIGKKTAPDRTTAGAKDERRANEAKTIGTLRASLRFALQNCEHSVPSFRDVQPHHPEGAHAGVHHVFVPIRKSIANQFDNQFTVDPMSQHDSLGAPVRSIREQP
jgi:hypothetical protein